MQLLIYLSLCTVLFLFSCQNNQKSNNNTSHDAITINLDNIDKDGHINCSSIFDKVRVTILETRDDNLISDISKMEVADDYFLILDARYAKVLYLFDKAGNFIRPIGRRGNGPGEYIFPNDFSIDHENNEVYVLDINLRKIFKYNLETGDYISSINVRYPDYHCLHIQYHKGRLYTDVKFQKKTPDSYLLQEIDKTTGEQIKHWLPVDEYNCGLISIDSARPVFFSETDGNPKFADQFMTTLFSLNEDEVEPYLELKSKNLLTKDYIDKTFGEKSFMELTLAPDFRSLKKIHNIHEVFETDDFIVLAFILKNRSIGRYLSYNKLDKQINIGILADDLLFDESFPGSKSVTKFVASDANGLYRALVDERTFKSLQKCIQEGYIREDVEQYGKLKELTEDSNPVILYYECKKTD